MHQTYREMVDDLRRSVIIEALVLHSGDTTQAAAGLHMPIATFYRHCKALGIKPKDYARKDNQP